MSVAGHIHIKEQRKSSTTKMQMLKPENMETVFVIYFLLIVFSFSFLFFFAVSMRYLPNKAYF